MKYWLFDGNDVVGPFTLGELASRPDFSAASLICAEDASEDAAGWQMASFFETFRFNPVTGRVDGVFPAEKQTERFPSLMPPSAFQPAQTTCTPAQERPVIPAEQTVISPVKTGQPPADLITESNTNWVPPEKIEKVVPSAKKTATSPQVPQVAATPGQTTPKTAVGASAKPTPVIAPTPRKKDDFSFVRLSRSKRLQEPLSPVALAREDVDLILPQNSQPAQSAHKSAEQLSGENSSAPAKNTPVPETEIISTCTLPIVNEILIQSDLPELPEGDFPPVALPAHPQFAWKEALADSFQPAEINATLVADQPFTSPGKETEPAVYVAPQRPQTPIVAQAEKGLVPQNQVEDLMLEQQFLEKPTRKKAHAALGVLLVALLGCAGWFFGVPYVRALSRTETKPQPAMQIPPRVPAVTPKKEATPAPAPQPLAVPKPVTAADKALASVQNYQLAENRGTVAAYFDRVYASHLQQGYTANWSVEPLHKNIYIVKYRLTKTRMEPIVYVFQADGEHEKLTGALNNVALDLIGRI